MQKSSLRVKATPITGSNTPWPFAAMKEKENEPNYLTNRELFEAPILLSSILMGTIYGVLFTVLNYINC